MLDYGFNGYQIPAVPRACRSPRGRVPVRKKCDKNQRHDEFDILARVAENFSGRRENRASADRLRQEAEEVEEATEAKNGGFVVSNFLETMEHGVEHVSVIGSEKILQESLSKDWLALGPSRSQSCISQVEYGDRLNQKDGNFSKSGKCRRASGSKIDCRVQDSSSAKADEFGYKSKNFSTPRNWKRVSDSNYTEHWTNDTRSNEVDQKNGTLIGLGNWKRTSNSNKIDYRADDPTGADKLDQKKTGNWNRVSDSKLDGKRKLCCPKERNSSETNSRESESIYPFKKRKFYHHNNLFESLDSPVQQRSAPKDRDCNVKFSIKSFKIPELFIDIPVSATVGSLKTTIMEAMMQILKNGLDVGVVLQGKKIRDDSKTLIQTEISGDDKNSSLGFTLEPRKPETTSSPPETFTGDSDVAGLVENKGEALAVVPYRRKQIWRPETVQRRIRRPFTVSEVEALVQAVERLGTGRWRDVKSRAFDHAKHRTYVDLKDKWKTLVHTARISPRQRRGEPVPQELLDRVLAAHAFWSDRQAELKLKPSP